MCVYVLVTLCVYVCVRLCLRFVPLVCYRSIWCCAVALSGIAPNLPVLFIARILSGVGEASFQTVIPPYIDDTAPKVPVCVCTCVSVSVCVSLCEFV